LDSFFYTAIIIFFAGFIQGFAGFGLNLLAVPLLSIFLDVKFAISIVAFFSTLNSSILLLKLRKHVEYQDFIRLSVSSVIGIPFGIYLLKSWDANIVKTTLGLILITYSLYSLCVNLKNIVFSKGAWAYLFGFLAGCLGGAFNTAGPPVIVYTSLKSWSKDRIKGTLQSYYSFSGLIIILFHALLGIATLSVIKTFLLLSPFLVVGTFIGSLFYDFIDTVFYMKIIYIFLIFIGIVLIISSIKIF